jgi:hypothetical protein
VARFDIAEFKAQVSNTGFLQTNKYAVYITANNALSGSFINSPTVTKNFTAMGNDLQFRCVAATLPGIILRTSDNNRFGLGILEKMPFAAAYTDIDLTFICDRKGAAYSFWYAWLNYIFASVGKESGRGVVDQISKGTVNGKRDFYTTQYKDNYSAIVDVVAYDNFENAAIEYKLYQAFPISINDSPLSWGDNNNLLKLTVKITFREWAIDEGNVLLQKSQSQNPSGIIFTPGTIITP